MDSKPHVSLSTTQATPSTLSSSSVLSKSLSTGSLLIRAPLTIDDDDDSDFESNVHNIDNSDSTTISSSSNNNSSDSGSELEECETASERPFVADPDEEIVEESGIVDKHEVFRIFVAEQDEEISDITYEDEVESSDVDEHTPVVELTTRVMRPIAQLSMDDDELDELLGDEGMESEVEDSNFSGVVKVPGIGVLEGIDSSTRLKVLGVDEGREDESLVGRDVSLDNQSEVVKNSVNDSVPVELVEDKGIVVVTQEAHVESSVGSKDDVLEKILKLDEDVKNIVEVRVEAEELMDCQNNESSSFDVSGSAAIDRGGDSEKPESTTEPGIDLRAELHDILSANKVDFIDNVIEQSDIQTVDSSGFSHPKPTQETMHLGNGDLCETTEGDILEDSLLIGTNSVKFVVPSSILDGKVKQETEDEANHASGILQGEKGSISDEDVEGLIFGNSVTTKQIMNELEQRLAPSSLSEAEGSQEHSQRIDGQIDIDSDEEVDRDTDGEGKELFDSAALAALLKAATVAESDGGGLTFTSADGSRVFSLERPTGSGSSFRSVRPAPPWNVVEDVSDENLSEEEKKKMGKIQGIRVIFLRLVHRLGLSPDDSIVAQVLHRLALALGTHSSQAFSLESAKRVAMQLEADGKDDLDFSLNILVLGKTGVGKSATINSIFGEGKAEIDAFEPATTGVEEIVGTIDGIKIRILDTPGLKSHVMQQAVNRKILASIKKFTKKFRPDVVLYVDRLDTHTRDLSDLPLLKSLTDSFSSSIWQNAIVMLTHAASAPPDGPSGSPISYEVFVAQRSHVVQQSISQAVGDLRLMNPSMMHPVSLVENHPSCQKNRSGESVLPNGQSWRPQLLLLCYSLKILSESNSVSKPQDPFDHKKLLGLRLRSPPLPYFLSSLLQTQVHPKLSADEGGNDVNSDIELGDCSDSEQEEEDDYDQLPPFKPLRKSQVAKLSKEQRKAYFEEYDYRVKLLQKKQWREEVRRLREMKKGKNGGNDFSYIGEDGDPEDGNPATIPVALPDLVLPPSFDSDNPAYRYRLLEPVSQLLVRPVLDSQGWDHDCGYDAVSLERSLAIAGRFPGSFAVQVTKDKNNFNIHLDSSLSAKHGENGSSMAGFDIQTVGRKLAYILKGETKFKNFKINKTTAGVSITLLDEIMATGVKIEDQIALGKHLVLMGSTGAMHSKGETAYGANLEVRLKDKDFPIGQDHSSLGLSLMKWRGDLGLMAHVQSQFSFGRDSKMDVRVGLNNKCNGQITLKISGSEQVQMALIGIVPLAISIFRSIYPINGAKNSLY